MPPILELGSRGTGVTGVRLRIPPFLLELGSRGTGVRGFPFCSGFRMAPILELGPRGTGVTGVSFRSGLMAPILGAEPTLTRGTWPDDLVIATFLAFDFAISSEDEALAVVEPNEAVQRVAMPIAVKIIARFMAEPPVYFCFFRTPHRPVQ